MAVAAGAEAEAIGRGGIALVARVSGASRTTVQSGVNEIRAGATVDGRVRAAVRGARRWRRRLLITADCGGSSGNRLWAWKAQLAALAAETGLEITVCHFPPDTLRWNKVEHQLFSFISISWRGRPLTDYQVFVQTIVATTTRSGLTAEVVLDTNAYPTGVRVSAAQRRAIPLRKYAFQGSGFTPSTLDRSRNRYGTSQSPGNLSLEI